MQPGCIGITAWVYRTVAPGSTWLQASVGIAPAELLRPPPPALNARQRAVWLNRLAVGGALLSRRIALITLNPLTYQVGNSVEFSYEGGWWAMTIKEITEGVTAAATAERVRNYLLSSMHFPKEHKVWTTAICVSCTCARLTALTTHYSLGERRAAAATPRVGPGDVRLVPGGASSG